MKQFFVALIFCPLLLAAQTPDTSEIKQLSPTVYKIGGLLLDKEKREITMTGVVNMDKGVVELLACAPGGKTHESVFVINVIPHHLQIALLLLGLNPVNNFRFQGDTLVTPGDNVSISVQWKKGNETVSVKAEECIYDIITKKTMEASAWVFLGSRVFDGLFRADVEKSLITTFHDPLAILDTTGQEGANDDAYFVNSAVVPTKGTPVTMIIKPLR